CRGACETLPHRKCRKLRAMEQEEHLKGKIVSTEFVLVQIDRGHASCDAILGRRVLHPRQAREVGGGVVEFATADEDLTFESQRSHVIRLEARHMLERLKCAFGVSLFAKNARLLPVEFSDFGVVVRDREALSDERKELVSFFTLAHSSKELVECYRS